MTPKYFDAHTHLNIQFNEDWKESGERAVTAGIAFVNVGADVERSKLAVEQARHFGKNGYVTVGIHPTEDGTDFEVIEKLAEEDCVVAIGECGLEYKIENGQASLDDNENLKMKEEQLRLFKRHIELALRVGKPLMIHCRASLNNTAVNNGKSGVIDAHEDVLKILREYKTQVGDRLRFNMHFFTGTLEVAKKFIELGSYFSFNGVLTFTNQYDEVVKNIPLDHLMSETDAPFVAPVPHRGQRNEPAYVALVAERLAELRPEPREVVLEALVTNAQKFFSL